jgi:XTP/dITP diphosphohydrolase
VSNKNVIVLATHNLHKRKELEEILADLDVQVLTLDEAGIHVVIEEDGQTFAENALKKAMTAAAYTNGVVLADDSGLAVDALNGAPGVYSARFAGENASDQANNLKLLEMLKDIPMALRTGRFVCSLAVCTPQGRTAAVEGYCEGRIGFGPRGEGGFGYDPLFIPDGYDQSFAELGAEIKNQISHRSKALQQVKKTLEKVLAQEW